MSTDRFIEAGLRRRNTEQKMAQIYEERKSREVALRNRETEVGLYQEKNRREVSGKQVSPASVTKAELSKDEKKPPVTRGSRPTVISKRRSDIFWAFLLGLLVGIGLTLGVFKMAHVRDIANISAKFSPIPPKISEPVIPKDLEALETEIRSLRERFPNQDEELWNIVAASVEDVLFDPRPAKPAVLLMASYADGTGTMHCLGEALSKTLANFIGSDAFDINLSRLDRNNPGQAKFELDHKLRKGFESGHKLVVLRDLQLLPGEVAILLHMYADNQNAPYKRAVIILLCQITEKVSEPNGEKNQRVSKVLDASQWDMVVNGFLLGKWRSFQGESKAQALISRLACNVVFVHPSEITTETCEVKRKLQTPVNEL